MNFFTADPHFGHANIIKYCQRPFANVEEMDRVLTEKWNAKIGSDDDVWILGDFTMRSGATALNYLRQLNGHKHLILGNHDGFAPSALAANLLDEVVNYKELKLQSSGLTAVLCHYPLLFWNGSHNGSAIMLYGHIHNAQYSNQVTSLLHNALNVGIDCCDYAPLSEDEVLKRICAHNKSLRYCLNDSGTRLPPAALEHLHSGQL